MTSPAPKAVSAGNVAAAVFGNALEFFDFTSYAFFAVMIGRAFFPAETPLGSLMLSVAAFGVGFVTRPLGAIVIGAYADRAGRKPAMVLTIALMAVGMLTIAVTPPYAVIGPLASVLVVFSRLAQGFALGGEVGPATSYLVEAAPADKRALYASWQLASQGLSTLASGILGVLLSTGLSPAAMQSWGWRVPFVLGLAIIPFGIIIRRRLPETLEQSTHATSKAVLGDVFVRQRRLLVRSILLIMPTTIAVYIGNYMTSYALTTLKMGASVSFAATLTTGICRVLASLAGGRLADRIGRKPVMIGAQIVLLSVTYPCFLLLTHERSLGALVLTSGLLAVFTTFGGAVGVAVVAESFSASARSAGVSIAYAVAVTVFGGSAQLVVTWLIAATGDPLSPAWYLIATSLVGIVAMATMTETGGARVPSPSG